MTIIATHSKMLYKGADNIDTHHLIDDQVYRVTTEVNPNEEELHQELLSKRIFVSKGIITVIISTFLITLMLLSFLYIQTFHTVSIFRDTTLLTSRQRNSSWKTTYVLPDIPLIEIFTNDFDFDSECPEGEFALVINLETPLDVVEPWLEKCGLQVVYFRMNGKDLEVDDVNKTLNYVQNAQYIPVKGNFHGVKDSYNILGDWNFQKSVDIESTVISALQISGFVTANDLHNLLDLIPFVEELTLLGSELCTSLFRQPSVDLLNCGVSLSELRKLRISFGSDCVKTFELIDRCWQMPQIKTLEIEGTSINDVNVKYIEDIIDRFRIMGSKFHSNVCSSNVLKNNNYLCL